MPLRYVDLCWLQTGLCVHFLKRRGQESLRINFSGHQFLGPSGRNEVYIRNAHESKDSARIWYDEQYENGEESRSLAALGMTGEWPFGAQGKRDELAATKVSCAYSVRSARIGSIVAARHAGTTQAATATSSNNSAEASRVSGSRELPLAHDTTTRFSATLSPSPIANPKPSMVPVDASTSRMMLVRGAPSAMRIPTSWVRCVTANDTTLYSPVAASASANTANSENSVAINRSWPQPCVSSHHNSVWSETTTISGFNWRSRSLMARRTTSVFPVARTRSASSGGSTKLYGKKIAGFMGWSKPSLRASPTTPMICSHSSVDDASSSEGCSTFSMGLRTLCPIGSPSPMNCLTKDWFTTAKCAARSVSASSNTRPASKGMRSVRNSCGLTRHSMACASVSEGLPCTSIFAVKPPNPGNHVVETLAVSTPGASVTVLRTNSFAFSRASHPGFAPFGKPMFMEITWSGSNPNLVWMRATNARIAAPAAASSTSVSATWPAISSRCVFRLCVLPVCFALLAWIKLPSCGRESCQAGETPKRIPVTSAIAALNASTAAFT